MATGLDIRKLVVFLACLAGLCSVPSLAAELAKASKFDLVFLVGVEEAELKPGVQVFVEPILFTDGKEFVFVYDYCRREYERTHKKRAKLPVKYIGLRGLADHEMRAEDLVAIRHFCAYESFRLKGENYDTVSSLGTRLRLGDITFTDEGERSRYIMPPQMPQSGQALITGVEGPNLQIAGRERFWGPKHYFLTSRNAELLGRLMPVQNVAEATARQFVARALAYICDPGRVVIWPCRQPEPEGSVKSDRQRPSSSESNSATELTDPKVGQILLADMDGDGLLDAAVGLRATDPRRSKATRKEEKNTASWSVTVFLLGNGTSRHSAGYSLIQQVPDQFHYYMPLAYLKLGDCNYVVTNAEETEKNLFLLAQPEETKTCTNKLTYKEPPAGAR